VTAPLNLVADPAPAHDATLAFTDAMSALAGGVVLVTCRVGDRPWGMTVTSFVSVSADPPTILVALGAEATSVRAIRATGRFGVSILAEHQVALAWYASAPGEAKFLERFVEPGGYDSPAIAGALAHLQCELRELVEVGDHVVLIGRVGAAHTRHEGAPLVYQRRAYRTVSAAPSERKIRWLTT
jgi:flavin reductase (DIM6/NTAB) family NADH-FMN oxidoreductase RutF